MDEACLHPAVEKIMNKQRERNVMEKLGHNVRVIKTWQDPFCDILNGIKRFEYRINDRNYLIGNILVLREYHPESNEYSGRSICAEVVSIYKDGYGIPDGYCIMGIKILG